MYIAIKKQRYLLYLAFKRKKFIKIIKALTHFDKRIKIFERKMSLDVSIDLGLLLTSKAF